MKLLYLSCHAILEYDELKLFSELGIDWFSLGSYIQPTIPADPIRPALPKVVNEGLLHMEHDRDHLTKDFIDRFDTIIVMHKPEWIRDNWDVLRSKRVIWRTIGQSTPHVEEMLRPFRMEGLEVVRCAMREKNISGHIGCDKIIHFYKDPEEFNNYNGLNKFAVTLAQNMIDRGEHCQFKAFDKVTEGLPRKLYGTHNQDAGDLWAGFLTYPQMQQMLKDNRVYIYTGTQPASYTLNFIEAFMTGIPVVAIGEKWGNSLEIAGKDTYEVPDFIQNGINGFISNDLDALHEITKQLLEDPVKCKLIGAMGRQSAIELFGKDVIKLRWKEFLGV